MNATDATPTVILLVEDEALVRVAAADILTEEGGFRIVEAGSAAEALTLLETSDDVRLVVTDVEMPGHLNGFALARIVDMRFPGIKVIVTSGRVRPGAGDLPKGARFLPKPYTPAALIGMVRETLGPSAKPAAPPRDVPAVEQGAPVLPAGIMIDQLHTGIGVAGGLAQPLPDPDE
jgi:two-component system, response regulator PdtaR